jgi:hypothetical protein
MEPIDEAGQGGIARRGFLLQLVALGVVAVLPGRALGAERRRKKKTKTVFRLSSHRRRTCQACKAHGANRFYRTRKAADKDRAHPGCNCAIVTQTLDRRLAKQYFKGRRKVFDLRSEVS